MLLAYLFLAHLLYDFHWQGDFVGIYKAKNKLIMFVYCLTWALLLSIIMHAFKPVALVDEAIVFSFLFASHWYIDAWKCRQPDDIKLGMALVIDQLAHVITIILVYIGRLHG